MTRLLNLLELKRGEEMSFLYLGMEEMGGLYSSGGENMNRKSFNESWQRIMYLDLILVFGEIGCIKFRGWLKWVATKIGSPVATITAYRAKFKK